MSGSRAQASKGPISVFHERSIEPEKYRHTSTKASRWHRLYACVMIGAPRWERRPPAWPALTSSLVILKSEEHGHAGLLKAHTPNTIKRLATKRRGGGMHTKFHSGGRVQWLAAGPNLLPPASPAPPRSRPGNNIKTRTYRIRSAASRCTDPPTIEENGSANKLSAPIAGSFDLPADRLRCFAEREL